MLCVNGQGTYDHETCVYVEVYFLCHISRPVSCGSSTGRIPTLSCHQHDDANLAVTMVTV